MSISLISPESNPDDPFTSPNSNPEEVIVVKRGGGRPKSVVWNYFEHNALKHPGHFDAKCKFCGTYWKNGIVKNLQVHLASKCENVDAETKNKFMHHVATRDGIINEDQMEIESDSRKEELSEEWVALIDRSILKAFVKDPEEYIQNWDPILYKATYRKSVFYKCTEKSATKLQSSITRTSHNRFTKRGIYSH